MKPEFSPPQDLPAESVHGDRPALPNLDGIRALACLLVVLRHMLLPGLPETVSAVGVGVFFTLSGFLMSYLYGFVGWDARAVGRYAIARCARIAPIYWLVISACVAISYAEPGSEFTQRIEGSIEIARHYLFVGSAGVFWSIPPEVQYYAFFVLIWWAIAHRAQWLYVVPVALLCLILVLTHRHWPGLALPNKLHFFVAGSIAGLLPRLPWSAASDRVVLFVLQLAALACLIVPLWIYGSSPAFYAAAEIAIAFGAAVYLLSIPSRWTSFVFASPLLRKIGQASFSIYLMHQIVLHFGARWFGLAPGSFDPAWLALGLVAVALPMLVSHYVEVPLSGLTRRLLERASGLASGRPKAARPTLAPTFKT